MDPVRKPISEAFVEDVLLDLTWPGCFLCN